MKIFIFKRHDGSVWADYTNLGTREGYQFVRHIEASSRSDIESVISSPGEFVPERVKALAERALSELLARGQQPAVTRQQHAVAVAQVERWGIWKRLKWIVAG